MVLPRVIGSCMSRIASSRVVSVKRYRLSCSARTRLVPIASTVTLVST